MPATKQAPAQEAGSDDTLTLGPAGPEPRDGSGATGVTRPAEPRPIEFLMGAILGRMPAIGKTQRNEQQNFMFRGHDDVMNALNPLLAEYGVFIMPRVLERVTAQRTTSRGAVMYETNLHVAFRFYGPAGDYVEASGWGEGTDMGDKATSKATTMAFKYVLNTVLALSTEESLRHDSDRGSPEETYAGGGAGPADAPSDSPVSIKDAVEQLDTFYVGSAQPWIEEAAQKRYEAEPPLKESLSPTQRLDLTRRLANVVAFLDTNLGTSKAAEAANGTDEQKAAVQAAVREAFAAAFDGLEILGPETFEPTIPF